jgi:hypothetical protein
MQPPGKYLFWPARGLLVRWEQLRVGYFFGGDGESVLRIAAGGLCAGSGMAHAAPQQAAEVALLAWACIIALESTVSL